MQSPLHPVAFSEPRVPIEIAEDILDELDGFREYAAIRVCARVCKKWLIRSQVLLWHTLIIENPGQLHSLRTVLQRTPGLGLLVVNVMIHTVEYGLRSYKIHDTAPLVLLSYLPRVRTWDIQYSSYAQLRPFSQSPASLACLSQYAGIREVNIDMVAESFPLPATLFHILAQFKSLEVLRARRFLTCPSSTSPSVVTRRFNSCLREIHVSLRFDSRSYLPLTSNPSDAGLVATHCATASDVQSVHSTEAYNRLQR